MGTPALATESQAAPQDMAQAYQNAKTATLDAYITGRLITAYALSEHLAASNIQVYVRDQRAILSGTVENSIQNDLAVEIARSVDGVRGVESKLQTSADLADSAQVEKQTSENNFDSFADQFNDAAIKARVKTRLLWNSNVSGLMIEVTSLRGDITLRGAVSSAEQSALAEAITANTPGVESVDNQMTIQTAAHLQ